VLGNSGLAQMLIKWRAGQVRGAADVKGRLRIRVQRVGDEEDFGSRRRGVQLPLVEPGRRVHVPGKHGGR
jgi:hypothetical protein